MRRAGWAKWPRSWSGWSRFTPRATVWNAVQPLAYAASGQPDAGRTILGRLTERQFHPLSRGLYWVGSVAYLAEACLELGDTQAADVLYPALLPHRRRIATMSFATVLSTVLGSVEHFLGTLAVTRGQHDLARDHFAHAVAVNNRVGARAAIARTRRACAHLA